ncbi:hypothetical protein CH373_17320 [Leptospira perolatii]|uniref:Rubrerythrin n=1 Tax=Leptospira perolatii TaxID=2023191 RepID=A0A2M9ZIP0_9LEPT|nr:hypothetical protein [Leptospira perolatii]PJZ68551.1 hypothetical protein CH360_15780 [Leptospira perolatii]PJZ71881.1 hypothetical protein CH373_17320 [Leptospira perolatii]
MSQSTTLAEPGTIPTQKIRLLLERITSRPKSHAKWLNTLSLLEHIGSRKIHASQTGNDISEMVLRHASEEARHAAFFKKLALKIGDQEFSKYSDETLLTRNSAVLYFQRLDATVHKNLKKDEISGSSLKRLAYLYVTKLIEERAEAIYSIYESILNESNSGISLKSVIKEEENHLYEMNHTLEKEDKDFQARSEFFREKESRLFAKFFTSLNASV